MNQNKTKILSILGIFVLLISIGFAVFYYLKHKDRLVLDTIKIHISKENFEKIKAKRKEALDLGILLTSKEDYVRAYLEIDTQLVKSKLRLKGDWVDHLQHPEKWSFRIKIGKGMTYHGMRKISLQHPTTRNFTYEWLFHKMQEEMGLVALRYEFVKLNLIVGKEEKELGIFALEEAFDKRMIENNERRSGVILKFDESKLWEERALSKQTGCIETPFETMYLNAPISSFNKNKVRKDSLLAQQFKKGSSLLNGYRNGTLPSTTVFDLDKIGKFMALVNLFGGEHAVIWHNLRFYYNPITALLEPIGFDMIGGKKYDYVIQSHILGNDSSYLYHHNKHLHIVQKDSFINHFKNKYQEELQNILFELNTEFEDITFDEVIFKHNILNIRNYLEKNNLDKALIKEEKQVSLDFKTYGFIEINKQSNRLIFKKGNWVLEKTLIIPANYTVKAEAGFNLDLKNGAEIISESAFEFIGTVENPIKIFSSNNDGDGLFLKNCTNLSVFENVKFYNLSNPKTKDWSITGAVTFYKSNVSLNHVEFKNNRSEDALNVFKADLKIENSYFSNTFSDAFDGDFITGEMTNCYFSNLGNDAIDVSGSSLYLKEIHVSKAADKGISAGERSKIEGENIFLNNSELAVSSKDLSVIRFSNINIDSCKVAYTAFQKKSEFDKAIINVSNAQTSNYKILQLVDQKSTLIYNGEKMPTTTNVMDRLYGNEFGKSSK